MRTGGRLVKTRVRLIRMSLTRVRSFPYWAGKTGLGADSKRLTADSNFAQILCNARARVGKLGKEMSERHLQRRAAPPPH